MVQSGSFNELMEVGIIGLFGFIVCFLSLPVVMKKMKERGIVGYDVHKIDHPLIPEMGGLAILLGLLISTAVSLFIIPNKRELFLSFIGTVLIAGLIGAYDDLRPLNAKLKPLLTAVAGLPIYFMNTYTPSIVFPFIGGTRLTRVYPLLLPIVMAVTSNAVNMMDPFNGVMAGSSSIITVTLFLSSIILGKSDGVILSAALLGVLLAFYIYNRYPSRVFSGDVGSLCVGSALGAIAILGRLEVIAVVAFMPQIMNAFYGLSTIGRLYERREVARPTKLLKDGRMMARADPGAPITLARFILARGPLKENEVTFVFMILSAISGGLALLTAYMMLVLT
jgi:UDP-N-acetylglucosamine--dolichyl-phosphate N-acetylglucosaminephosphotransferase